MVDYELNSNFDIFTTEKGGIAEVDDLQEFEDDLVTQIEFQFSDILGGRKSLDNITQKITLLTTRIAKRFDVIDRIQRLNVTVPENKPETISVEITYSSGELFEKTL
jgi:hypothetical protein